MNIVLYYCIHAFLLSLWQVTRIASGKYDHQEDLEMLGVPIGFEIFTVVWHYDKTNPRNLNDYKLFRYYSKIYFLSNGWN